MVSLARASGTASQVNTTGSRWKFLRSPAQDTADHLGDHGTWRDLCTSYLANGDCDAPTQRGTSCFDRLVYV
jgi:hypothetical protein